VIQAGRPGATQGAPATIRTAGDSALVLRLANVIDPTVNARVIAMADSLRAQAIRGVRDVVSTYHSVAVHFDPLAVDAAVIRSALQRALAVIGEQPVSVKPTVELPVTYGGEYGPDLDAVAAFAGISPQQVIEQHAGVPYRVFMLGFVPGFPYMGIVSPPIAMPRRATPRVRVARGSVGIAGAQTGIYPHSSPGGWQIIGRTPVTLFDPERIPPAILSPGDAVRFVPTSEVWGPPSGGPKPPTGSPAQSRSISVVRPGLFTTIQDTGRWGYQAYGVSVSGAMDRISHRLANMLVGNEPGAATLEVTLVGPELGCEHEATIAVTGGDLSATVDGVELPLNKAVRCAAGSVLRFGERRSGSRAYVAFDGGLDTPRILGSRSTHVRSGLGGFAGRAIAGGDLIPLGRGRMAPPAGAGPAATSARAGGARLRVLAGPEDDFFPIEALETIRRTRFTIAPQSDRMGYRLQGERVPTRNANEMISDAAFVGAIQVPPSGEPILLMADRQTTGGYPQLATVITADLPLAAQLAPGDWIEFEVCTRAEALAALVGQEGTLRALG
jgi:KipI family sensor histidine kinase inhibitor